MITALKSVLMCSEFDRNDDGTTNILGLIGETLRADSAPGVVDNWVFISVDVDGRGATGEVLSAPSYSFAVPFEVPPGVGMTAFSFPIVVPVLSPSDLHIAMIDDARRGKPFRAKWKLGFHPDAEVVDEEARRFFIGRAKEAAEEMVRNLSRQSSHGTMH
jgi:hypothetical protein